jgi:peptide/nickel transport system substrate-binding protein
VAQAIANYLGQVGINIELQGMEYSAFFPLWANRKLNGLHLFAYGPSIMDADQIIGSLYDSTGVFTGSTRSAGARPAAARRAQQG